MAKTNNPYGDWFASVRIADILEKGYTSMLKYTPREWEINNSYEGCIRILQREEREIYFYGVGSQDCGKW